MIRETANALKHEGDAQYECIQASRYLVCCSKSTEVNNYFPDLITSRLIPRHSTPSGIDGTKERDVFRRTLENSFEHLLTQSALLLLCILFSELQANAAPPPPEMKEVLKDDFQGDSRKKYWTFNSSAVLKTGKVELRSGAQLIRAVDAGPATDFEVNLVFPPLTKEGEYSETQLSCAILGKKRMIATLSREYTQSEIKASVKITTANILGFQKTLRSFTPHGDFQSGRWTVQYRYGLLQLTHGGKAVAAGYVANESSPVKGIGIDQKGATVTCNEIRVKSVVQKPTSAQVKTEDLELLKQLEKELTHFFKNGRKGDAFPTGKRYLALRQRVHGDNHYRTAEALVILVHVATAAKDAQAAYDYQKQALEVLTQVLGESHPTTLAAMSNLGLFQIERGEFRSAQHNCEQALANTKRVLGENHPTTATVVNNLGMLYQSLGDHRRAEQFYKQSAEIKKEAFGEKHTEYATSLNNLGELYVRMGRYTLAEEQLLAAKTLLAQGQENLVGYSTVLHNLSLVYYQLGDYARAERHVLQAQDIFRKARGEKHPGYAIILSASAELSLKLGKVRRAERLYLQAIEVFEETLSTKTAAYAIAHNGLACLYLENSEHLKAQRHFRRAVDSLKDNAGTKNLPYAGTVMNLGMLHFMNGNYTEAEERLNEAREVFTEVVGKEHFYQAMTLLSLGGVYATQQRWNEAAIVTDVNRRMVRSLVGRVLPALNESDQITFLKTRDEIMLHWSLSLGLAQRTNASIAARSASWVLNGKAVIQESLGQRQLLGLESANPSVNQITEELRAVRAQLSSLTYNGSVHESRRSHSSKIEALLKQEQTLSRDLSRATGRENQSSTWIELKDVRRKLPQDTVLIEIARFHRAEFSEYQLGPPHYAAWIIPPAGTKPVEVIDLGEAKKIDEAVQTARQAINSAPQTIPDKGRARAEKELQAAFRDLSHLVLSPLLSKVDRYPKWRVSPDADLWLIPWGALPLPDNRYAIEQHQITYLVSGRDLVLNKGKSASNRSILMADPDYDLDLSEETNPLQSENQQQTRSATVPAEMSKMRWSRLPGSFQEAQAIIPHLTKYCKSEPNVHLRQQAVERVLKSAHQPKVLMISTHGFFLEDQDSHAQPLLTSWLQRGMFVSPGRPQAPSLPQGHPIKVENPLLRCGLVLAGANQRANENSVLPEDGLLTGLEIVGTDLRGTDLIVLSACETGLGEVRNGEGVASLRQAFQLAGGRTVVSTLWKIPDQETAALMSTYFENLAAGYSKADALHQAQLDLIKAHRKKHGDAHPFFWAAFTHTGDPGKGMSRHQRQTESTREHTDNSKVPPPASTPSSESTGSSYLPVGVLAGGTILAVALVLFYRSWRKRKNAQQPSATVNVPMPSATPTVRSSVSASEVSGSVTEGSGKPPARDIGTGLSGQNHHTVPQSGVLYFRCVKCADRLWAASDAAGKRVQCPNCKTPMFIGYAARE